MLCFCQTALRPSWKIEKAIQLRDGGADIAIISEERFFDYLHG